MLKFIDYLNEGKEFKQLKFIVDPIIEQVLDGLKKFLSLNKEYYKITFTTNPGHINTGEKFYIEVGPNMPEIDIVFGQYEAGGKYYPIAKYIKIGIQTPVTWTNLQEIQKQLKRHLTHELTHYYQHSKGIISDDFAKHTNKNLSRYLLLPVEIEAYLKGWYHQVQLEKTRSLRQYIIEIFNKPTLNLTPEERKIITDTYIQKAQEIGLNLDKYQDYESFRDKFRKQQLKK